MEVVGDLELDRSKHKVWQGKQLIDLTPLEFQILEILMQAPGQVVRRADLAMRLMENGYTGSETTLKIHIRNLRLKLDDNLNQPRYMETVFGIGYRFLEGHETFPAKQADFFLPGGGFADGAGGSRKRAAAGRTSGGCSW